MPFMRAPNCATGPLGNDRTLILPRRFRSSLRRRRRRHAAVAKRIEIPVEERPHAVPRIALLPRVLRLPRPRIDEAIEGVAARRVLVHLRLRQERLARAE